MTNHQKIETIIFDVGGTLINSSRKLQLIFENPVEFEVLKKINPKLELKDYVRAVEELLKEKIDYTSHENEYAFHLKIQEKMKLRPTIAVSKAMRQAYDAFEEKILPEITNKNAIPLLDYLHAKQYRLGIISNSTRAITTNWLTSIGKTHYFSAIILSHEVKVAKPSKEIFQHCIDQLHANPQTTLMVGDMKADLGAKAIGIRTCILDYGQGVEKWNEKPDYVVKDLIEIKKILEAHA